MTGAEIMSYVGGVAMFGTAVALMLWQIMSAPDRPNYPTSGGVKRALMFTAMIFAAGAGMEIIDLTQQGVFMRPRQVGLSIVFCALFSTFLIDHLRHWLPARTHRRIRQLLAIARCRPDPAIIAARTANAHGRPCEHAGVVGVSLAELESSGWRTAAPLEGPNVFTER